MTLYNIGHLQCSCSVLARRSLEFISIHWYCGVVRSVDWDIGMAALNLGEAKQSYDRWHEATGGSRCGLEGTS